MKTLPPFWRNQLSKIAGAVLLGPLLSYAQVPTPVAVPKSSAYPGILETLEKLIQIDSTRFNKKKDLLNKSRLTSMDASPDFPIELDVDFVNSLVLHSEGRYLRLASVTKCHFYGALINDLLKTSEGKVNNVLVSFTNKKGEKAQALLSKKDFIINVVGRECPKSANLIELFQLKNISSAIRETSFEPPNNESCGPIYYEWLNSPKTPYFCKVHEFIKEASLNRGNSKDLAPRKAMAQALQKKISVTELDYLENICTNLDDKNAFCDEFTNISYWTRLAQQPDNKFFAQDICAAVEKTSNISVPLLKQCLSKLRNNPDLCLYPAGRNQGLVPQPQCDTLSTALNHSTLKADYQDCPSSSDQQGITNLARLLLNYSQEKVKDFNGVCSAISSSVFYRFNKQFNNDENWKLEACYEDKLAEKEKCYKTYFGAYGESPESYNFVVAEILKQTRGADSSVKCRMIDSEDYNPLLLEYKSGCYIIFERNKCFMSQCKHKILYNDRTIDYIKIKNALTFDYFPNSVKDERFSQHYLLTKDFNREGRSLQNLNSIHTFYKKNRKGIIHGIGCAEDLLPGFFRKNSMNQCTPLPFLIDGMVKKANVSFVVRTGVDSLQAPRIIGWSQVFSAVKTYQRLHPLRVWTLYGMD